MRLKQRYETLTTSERKALAERAGIQPEYLYQLATGFRNKRPSLAVMLALVKGDKRLTLKDLAAEFAERSPAKRAAKATA